MLFPFLIRRWKSGRKEGKSLVEHVIGGDKKRAEQDS
jgi:hypothetical protein